MYHLIYRRQIRLLNQTFVPESKCFARRSTMIRSQKRMIQGFLCSPSGRNLKLNEDSSQVIFGR
jgi:hypothetical protein